MLAFCLFISLKEERYHATNKNYQKLKIIQRRNKKSNLLPVDLFSSHKSSHQKKIWLANYFLSPQSFQFRISKQFKEFPKNSKKPETFLKALRYFKAFWGEFYKRPPNWQIYQKAEQKFQRNPKQTQDKKFVLCKITEQHRFSLYFCEFPISSMASLNGRRPRKGWSWSMSILIYYFLSSFFGCCQMDRICSCCPSTCPAECTVQSVTSGIWDTLEREVRNRQGGWGYVCLLVSPKKLVFK